MSELGRAVRRLRRRPLRGLATASTLAIGLGATTAALAAVDQVLVRDLPVRDQDELVVAWLLKPDRGPLRIPLLTEDYEVVTEGAESLAAAAGFTAWGALAVPAGDAAEPLTLAETRTSGDFFGVLGAEPALGRLLAPEDDAEGAAPVAVLSYDAWRGRFGGEPTIVGTALVIRDVAHTVVGIGPEGLAFPLGTDVWTPVRGAPFELHVLARARGGLRNATLGDDVLAALRTTGEPERRAFWDDAEAVVTPLEDAVLGPVRPVVRAGLVAALVLLLAACANATLFLLADAPHVAHELAVRRAMGARRGQLVGRLGSDGLVLGAVASVVAVILAGAALTGMAALAPPSLPRLDSLSLDARTAVAAVAVGLAMTGLVGLLAGVLLSKPGWRALGVRAAEAAGGAGLRRIVAGAQVALAVVTAVGAGLLLRTVDQMNRMDPGLAAEDMVAVSLTVPYPWIEVPPEYLAALERVVEELEARPGVRAVRPTLGPPLEQRLEVVLRAEGQSDEVAEENPYVAVDAVLPGHLAAMGIPLLAGRDLDERDDLPAAAPVALVDEVLAAQLWPGSSPLGERISAFGTDEWYTVVGVAAATRYRELWEHHPRAYYPLRRLGTSPPAALLIRTSDADVPVAELTRAALARADPSVRVMRVERMTDVLRAPTAGRRFAAGVLSFFAGATLLLAVLGVYGAFTVAVQERRREMGIRKALGAERSAIVRLVLTRILRVSVLGAVLGLTIASWATRFVEALLFGVPARDAPTMAAALVGCVALALAAGLTPALRASATDPAVSLRAE